jgi:hypothetical protein
MVPFAEEKIFGRRKGSIVDEEVFRVNQITTSPGVVHPVIWFKGVIV